MKANIHPDYHEITVVTTTGVEYKTRSTYGKEGAKLQLDIDPATHPAWTKNSGQMLDTEGRLQKFQSRFGKFGATEATSITNLTPMSTKAAKEALNIKKPDAKGKKK